jgi:hypothetical protein
MNQQTSYSLKASILEYKKIDQSSSSEESVFPTDIQNTPDVVELTRIMLGAISGQNARKMTLGERRVFYNIIDGTLAVTYKLN